MPSRAGSPVPRCILCTLETSRNGQNCQQVVLRPAAAASTRLGMYRCHSLSRFISETKTADPCCFPLGRCLPDEPGSWAGLLLALAVTEGNRSFFALRRHLCYLSKAMASSCDETQCSAHTQGNAHAWQHACKAMRPPFGIAPPSRQCAPHLRQCALRCRAQLLCGNGMRRCQCPAHPVADVGLPA